MQHDATDTFVNISENSFSLPFASVLAALQHAVIAYLVLPVAWLVSHAAGRSKAL